jgi:DNA-binding beta-propeller fold protein YncE
MSDLATELRPGGELLGFRVERVIGRGGMGVVYLAQQLVLDRLVALKLLAPELASDEVFRERFLRESRLAASLDHPNIVPVFDAGEVEGRLYIAMRYVEGRDLGRLLAEEGPLAPERAIALLAPVADALDAAHAKGLVHRDVKPSNILLDQAERPYLADFGLTKESSERGLVEQSHFAASLGYVAPEQIEGRPVDGGADQYALACVLFVCLTGGTPFANGSPMAALWGHLNDPPPGVSERNPQLPEAVDSVFEHALAKDPAERYATCGDFATAATRALGLAQAPRLLRPRWMAALTAAVLLLAAAAAVGAILAFGGDRAPKPDLTVRHTSAVRIDPETNEVAAVVDVGPGPKAIAIGGRTVWVYNIREGTVTAIDAETSEIQRVSRVSTYLREQDFATGPVLAADESGAWVVGSPGTNAAGIPVGQGVLTRINLSSAYKPEYQLDYDPLAVAVGEGAVWVAALEQRGGGLGAPLSVVLRITPDTGAVQKVPVGAGFHGGIRGIAVGEGAVWGMDSEEAILHRIDPVSIEITGRVDLGENAAAPVVGSGFVWAAKGEDFHQVDPDKLMRVDPETLRVSRVKVRLPIAWDVAAAGGSVWWWSVTGTLTRIDPEDEAIAATIRLPPKEPGQRPDLLLVPSGSLAAGPSGVWVTNVFGEAL